MKIPLFHSSRKMLADTFTPVSAYLNLRDHFPNSLLLESSDYHSQSDSYSFICLDPVAGFEATGNEYHISFPGQSTEHYQATAPSEVRNAFARFVHSFEAPVIREAVNPSGLFGYSSFEAVQYFEDIRFTAKPDEEKRNPDLKYQLFRYVLVFDHFRNELSLHKTDFTVPEPEDSDLEHIISLLRIGRTAQFGFRVMGEEVANLSEEEFRSIVRKGIAHCQRGDVFQVVLSREFRQAFQGDDFNVYRSIRSINPSPYLFYFDYGSFRIFGSSPESQLQVAGGMAYINPIAGTVRRTGDQAEDQSKAEQLRNDPKENSEHIMLVDLARNDLSRSTDQVKVEVYAEVQYFSHVIHLVSKVSGTVRAQTESLDIYADTFPAGTLSGAPKHRAMQIIDDNEPSPRNFYGGAIGFFGFDGSINHAIIIRSVLSKNNQLIYQAGAGVVVRSSPESELQEVNNKVAAMRRAISNAEKI